jgi:hypothetical protein
LKIQFSKTEKQEFENLDVGLQLLLDSEVKELVKMV